MKDALKLAFAKRFRVLDEGGEDYIVAEGNGGALQRMPLDELVREIEAEINPASETVFMPVDERVEQVVKVCAQVFEVPEEELYTPYGLQYIREVRFVVMYIVKRYKVKKTHAQTAEIFAQGHSASLHARKKVEELGFADTKFREKVSTITEILWKAKVIKVPNRRRV